MRSTFSASEGEQSLKDSQEFNLMKIRSLKRQLLETRIYHVSQRKNDLQLCLLKNELMQYLIQIVSQSQLKLLNLSKQVKLFVSFYSQLKGTSQRTPDKKNGNLIHQLNEVDPPSRGQFSYQTQLNSLTLKDQPFQSPDKESSKRTDQKTLKKGGSKG